MSVLVLGNATVDLSYRVERLPEPGETLLASARTMDAGGKGLNQAVAAARAGAAVRYVAPLGDDAQAAFIRARLREEGLAQDGLIAQRGATDESVIWISAAGENVIVSTAERARSLSPEAARAAAAGLAPGDLLLIQGNLTRAATEAALAGARAAGARTLLNPAPIHFDYAGLWPLVDVAIVNEGEARRLGGDAGPEGALRAAGAGAVVVTLGARGARWLAPEGCGSAPAPQVEAVDTTGAGDLFCGALAALLDAGRDLAAAVPLATRAASLAVLRVGASGAFPTRDELRAVLSAPAPA